MARRQDPKTDADVLLAIRKAVGPSIALRADANQQWTLQQAVAFAQAALPANLEVRSHVHLQIHGILTS